MKFNKWTLGLAAVGVVSLASAARADEKMNALQTALSNTTISGYVSASFNWAVTPGGDTYQNTLAAFIPYQNQYGSASSRGIYGDTGSHRYLSKQDGFNLDVVKLSISKPQDESPWASGYQIDLLFGPDAVGYNTSVNASSSADFAIKQAYVALRTPVGNGIDWKVGVFDSIIGYEVFDAGSNPNYTRSWGYAIEPTELTGVLASYKINDQLSVSAGIANTLMAGINARAWNYNNSGSVGASVASDPNYSKDWNKTLLGSVTFSAPSNWGWAAGSSFYAGIVYGFDGKFGASHGFHQNGNQINYYAGTTLNTPWKELTVGGAFDYAHNFMGGGNWSGGYWEFNVLAGGLYATYKATDKLSFNARGEYVYGESYHSYSGWNPSAEVCELTGTVEYDLWANVISRLELRWDHILSGSSFFANASDDDINVGSGDDFFRRSVVGLYANIIYKF